MLSGQRQVQDACQLVQVDATLFCEVLRHRPELRFVLTLNQIQALHDGRVLPAAPLPLDCPAGWRVPAGAPGAALASDSQAAGADPAGLAWFAICCTFIYLIIIGRLC